MVTTITRLLIRTETQMLSSNYTAAPFSSGPRSPPLGFHSTPGMDFSAVVSVSGSVDVVVFSIKHNCIVMGPDADAGRLLICADVGFNKLNMRMKISVGAIPCVNRVSSQQRFSLQVTNTHVDLRNDCHSDALGGVLEGEEDEKDKLRDQIEHAALNDDDDCSPTGSCRQDRA